MREDSSTKSLRCWAEIDLEALRHNLAVVRNQIGADSAIMAIVKANAYGHGLLEIAKAISHADVNSRTWFGVADVSEALELRGAIPDAPIYILGTALPAEREVIARNDFVPSVSSLEEAVAYHDLVHDRPIRVHLEIDTGMGRIGVWQGEVIALAEKIARLPRLEITGISTHLPVSDEDETFTQEQFAVFNQCLTGIRGLLPRAAVIHLLNSAGVIRFAGQSHAMVRAGLMLYGSSPIPAFQKQLRPVMTLKTRVTLVRDFGAGRSVSYGRTFITRQPTRVATLAIGYADGYQRHLSNRGAEVLIAGKRCPVLGRVTMDQIMADVTALEKISPGDEAVLMGRQGEQEILASEIAEKAGTIAWEIFTSIGPRVKRIYLPKS